MISLRAGILIRDAEALELAHRVSIVAFDKTGTLTQGKPALAAFEETPAPDGGLALSGLQIAAALQAGSEHPLARAVVTAAQALAVPPASKVTAEPGRGVRGEVEGRSYALGSLRWMRELGFDDQQLAAQAAAHQAQGHTVSWLAEIGSTPQLHALLAFGDPARDEARQAIASLHATGVKTVLLTGDHISSARAIAQALGVDDVRAEVLPADKARIINELRAGGQIVAMVGDGINDAPALAAADVGIAMGSGTDVAMNAAGITLMRADPRLVPEALLLSRRTTQKIRQNLFWAFIYNTAGIPLAAAGLLSPVFAGAAMAASSVSVVGNALLLGRKKKGDS